MTHHPEIKQAITHIRFGGESNELMPLTRRSANLIALSFNSIQCIHCVVHVFSF